MPSTIDKRKLIRIKHITLLEGERFLRNKLKIAFFLNKMHNLGYQMKFTKRRRISLPNFEVNFLITLRSDLKETLHY